MFAPTRLRQRVTLKLVWIKLKRSPINAGLAAAVPLLVLVFWIKGAFEPAANIFLFLLPHFFLFLSQDMARDEVQSGALENVLFLENGFKNYLLEKNVGLILAGTVYSILLFGPLWSYGLISHALDKEYLMGFLVSILAGIYYVGIGGFLSHYCKGGSNVLLVIVAQVGAFIVLLMSVMHQDGFFDCLEKGAFPGFGAKAKFLALTIILPNVVSAAKLRRYWPLLAILALAAFLFQRLKVRTLEVKRS